MVLVGAWHMNIALALVPAMLWSEASPAAWMALIAGPASTLPAVSVGLKAKKAGGYWLIAGAAISLMASTLETSVWRFLLQVFLPMAAMGASLLFSSLGERSAAVMRCGSDATSADNCIVEIGAVSHAILVLILWVALIDLDIGIVPMSLWLGLAWVWLLWPFSMVLPTVRLTDRRLSALAVAIAFLSPCAGTAYAAASWLLFGFAP